MIGVLLSDPYLAAGVGCMLVGYGLAGWIIIRRSA